jgi:hypothetical protein
MKIPEKEADLLVASLDLVTKAPTVNVALVVFAIIIVVVVLMYVFTGDGLDID